MSRAEDYDRRAADANKEADQLQARAQDLRQQAADYTVKAQEERARDLKQQEQQLNHGSVRRQHTNFLGF